MHQIHTSADIFLKQRFDYIVVGGGTAGLAVAARLAERQDLQIGVLEAGRSTEQDENVTVPAFYGRAISGENDWCFQTAPQAGLAGRRLPWPRGKALGGTSSLNFMTWVRASRADYDAWEALGNTGWGWDSLLPYFKKSETFHPPSENLAVKFDVRHNPDSFGTSGPIQISYNEEYSASHSLWHRTLNNLGIQTNVSHTSGSNVGVWTNINSVDPSTAARSYATSYLYSSCQASNLHILTDAQVKRLTLHKQDSRCIAQGVVFRHEGKEFEVPAAREVILSAGAVQSPQVLELSGIGNPDVLERAGIQTLVNSPTVGENLQEHIMLATIFEVDPTLPNPDDLLGDDTYAAQARREYEATRRGPLTILPCSICYVPLKNIIAPPVLAKLRATAEAHSAFNTSKTAIAADRFSSDINLGHIEYIFDLGNWSTSFKGEDGKKYGTMLQILQYPFSLGSVHIRPADQGDQDANVSERLDIDPGYYHGEHGNIDIQVMREATNFLQKLIATEPLADIIRCPAAPSAEEWKDAESLHSWIVNNTVTDWHPVGTCAMGGRAGVDGGVVNERLQVYGVENLRVVDASIMPLQISAHLQATVYAIAEKAADMILDDLARAQSVEIG
ncbi:hypothetical protein PWT90_01229 [Aphanocladium album]|nr:hypothetical protein PWT90_01229 [Aphanocladium album]